MFAFFAKPRALYGMWRLIMQTMTLANKELREMRAHIDRVVNSLELCFRCNRICECERHWVNRTEAVWLCDACVCGGDVKVDESPDADASIEAFLQEAQSRHVVKRRKRNG